MSIDSISQSPATPPAGDALDAKLRQVAAQLEGVFVEQLLKAMRDTVDSEGMGSGSLGEDLFSGMLDQTIADGVADKWERGIGAAVYRQLRAHIMQST
jgi:peptidoglycan hydrolase FlgJ